MNDHLVHPDTGKILFWRRELTLPDEEMILDPHFRAALIRLRVEFDRQMTVNSCCRSWAHNQAIGGHPRSLHVYDEPFHTGAEGTMAIDMRTPSGRYAYNLCALAMQHEWAVGMGPGFLHLDRRTDLGMDAQLFCTGKRAG